MFWPPLSSFAVLNRWTNGLKWPRVDEKSEKRFRLGMVKV